MTDTLVETLTREDVEQLASVGISEEEARRQLALLTHPPDPLTLDRPATLGDGIVALPEDRHAPLVERFEATMEQGGVVKFVPASGAATRMFKALTSWLLEEDSEPTEPVRRVVAELDRFAFYDDLVKAAEARGEELGALRERHDHRRILELTLTGEGLALTDLPKGLIPFHKIPPWSPLYERGEEARTPFEEHLVEAARYARAEDGTCRLHFTVSPEHEAGFRELLATRGEELGERLGCRFEVGFSHQSHATDTLAVTPEGEPFRLDDGSLLLRPGGHGALIGNLAALAERGGAGLVMVKNIDNVVPDERKGPTVRTKKLLGGLLLTLRDRAFELLTRLEADGAGQDGELLDAAERFAAEELFRSLPVVKSPLGPPFTKGGKQGSSGRRSPAGSPAERRQRLIELLDRPLRVCGVVKNEGEPGGGPFWVAGDGGASLQIVEGSQVAKEQQAVFAAGTHFNPVDLVCSWTDRHGEPYDLERFIDPDTVFIARKSHEGRPLDALERPGLWNGAMAGWNTVFVEVPIETFAPVKTVLDLLRPVHQATG